MVRAGIIGIAIGLLAVWGEPCSAFDGDPPGTAGEAPHSSPGAEGPPPITVSAPAVSLTGLVRVKLRADVAVAHRTLQVVTVDSAGEIQRTPESPIRVDVEIRDASGGTVGGALLEPGSETEVSLDLPSGRHELALHAPQHYTEPVPFSVRVIPGWLSLLPPTFAILLALVFRQVIPALLAGVWLGAWIGQGDPLAGLLRTVDHYLVETLADGEHISIVIFSMFLGGMVGVMSRAGGTAGLVDALRPYATSRRRGQLVTWALGLIVFFDDYANTLVVGNTMRPVTDRLKISREKLAYVVDSTAAPVAAIFLISTWIGYEVSMIGDALKQAGADAEAYSVFLQAIPYNFYPILALAFGFLVAWSGRDFGPMQRAEKRAVAGRVLAETAVPLADFDAEALAPVEGRPRRWINAAIPVAAVVLVTFGSLWLQGRASLVAAGDPDGTAGLLSLGVSGIGRVLGEGDSYKALLYAASAGCLMAIVLAVGQRILGLGQALGAMLGGFKSMVMAFVILTLAWSISQVCADLNTSGFMVSALTDRLDPRILPTLIFLLAAGTAFATGSSWSTMGILLPLAVPTAYAMAQSAGLDPAVAHRILLGSVASVLAGAIFGDHCSPISDTTVLSSMSSGCDHVDHVRTQLPYAVVVGVTGVLLGTLPAGYGMPPWLGLLLSVAVLGVWLRFVGRKS